MAIDPFGAERRAVQPDPSDRKALKIMKAYESRRSEMMADPVYGPALQELENREDYVLIVKYDPSYAGPTAMARVGEYKWDDSGNLIEATLQVGPRFMRPFPPPAELGYEYGSNLLGREKLQIYTILHEELGHGLPHSDAIYMANLWSKEAHNEIVNRADREAKAIDPDNYLPIYQGLLRQYGVTAESLAEAQRSGQLLEVLADKRASELMEESKVARKRGRWWRKN
jgi:hypothetical protein